MRNKEKKYLMDQAHQASFIFSAGVSGEFQMTLSDYFRIKRKLINKNLPSLHVFLRILNL